MSNPLTTNGQRAVLHLEVDRSRDLAPQVIVLQAIGLPWKLIEQLCGRRKNRLEEQVARFKAQLADRANLPRATLPDTASGDLWQRRGAQGSGTTSGK